MKKNIFNNRLGLMSIAAVLSLASCTDYLDIMPDNVATMEHAFSNRHVTEQFLFSCYNYLPNPVDVYASPAIAGSDEMWWSLDAAGSGGLRYYTSNAGYYHMGIQNANSPYLNYWDGEQNGKNMFIGIRDCNIFLENINLPTDIEGEEREQWIAEVKFLKAYFHFYLLRLYGPIPIIRENLDVNDASDNIHVFREPVDDVINYIVELLDEASPYLIPNTFDTRAQDAGRISQSVCAALKAQVLVWAASPLLNGSEEQAPSFSIIDKRGVQLFPQTYDPSKWTRATNAIKEAIEISYVNGHRLYEYSSMNASLTLSDISKQKCTLRGAITTKYNPEIIWPCTSNSNQIEFYTITFLDVFSGIGSNYYSELGPTLKMAEEFYTKNGLPLNEDEEWINWIGGNLTQRYDLQQVSTEDKSGINGVSSLSEDHKYYIQDGETTVKLHFYREPRFYAWMGFDRSIWELNGKGERDRFIRCRASEPQGYNGMGRHSQAGYFAKKLVNLETIQNSDGALSQTRYTYPFIRLTDLYLLYAEALNETKVVPDEEVYRWIDLVRERAGVPKVREAYAKAISTLRNKPNTQAGMREIIKRERRIELSFESQRFYDMLRWKDAYQYWNEPVLGWNVAEKDVEKYYQIVTIYNQRIFNTRDYFFPLRLSTLQVNNNLVQNPGW
jgi:hypothetical protein